MHVPVPDERRRVTVVFESPWFNIISRESGSASLPHLIIDSADFVTVIAFTPEDELLLVRQYRQGVQAMTLELPSGHVEPGDSPETAARKELLEETGYEADTFELIASLSPSTARFSNRLWCYIARNARPRTDAVLESGIERVVYRHGVRALLQEKEFCSAAQYGALAVALLADKVKL
jgi:ADP-ribose pyrophosphatase